MKVALLRPSYHTHLITPPLGLGYLSSYLQKSGVETVIIDALNLGLTPSEAARAAAGCDLAGIYFMTDHMEEAIGLALEIKKKGIPVVMGGPHATALPEKTLRMTSADGIVLGEGEETLGELITELKTRDIKDISIPGFFRSGMAQDKVILRDLIDDLDSIPFPDWAQMNPANYMNAPHGGLIKNLPAAPVITSRGCSHRCVFCASPSMWRHTIRYRNPEKVLDEIAYLVNEFKVKEIHFEDDNITGRRDHLETICRGIVDRGIKISWCCPNGVRAENLQDIEIFRLMKRSGCYMIAFGIESASHDILSAARKGASLDDINRAVGYADSQGIITQGFFIFGLPGESEITVKETIDFASKSRLKRAQFLFLDILPGSGMWEKYSSEIISDPERRSFQSVRWVPDTIKEAALQKAIKKAFFRFYLKPARLAGLLRFFRVSQIKYIIRRLRDFGIV